MMRVAIDMVSACASVLATMKSTPCRPAPIISLMALPPALRTPNTNARLHLANIYNVGHVYLRVLDRNEARFAICKPCGLLAGSRLTMTDRQPQAKHRLLATRSLN